MNALRFAGFGLGLLFLSVMAQILYTHSVSAVSATEFQAGRIIDDNIFYNTKSFSGPQAVQDFITSHTPTCDTWGTKSSGYGSLNRSEYAQQIKGWPGPPYVCLQNYYENPTTGQTSFEMGGGAFSGGVNAGQIIWDAAQQNGINPQVLLVLLKKESAGPLFSDSWPMKSQYKYAMGYACPDSGPNNSAACESSKAGFYKQVNLAAWQMKRYATNITEYNYQPGRWNYIQNSPDPSCGGRSVYIENVATASLYIYTPYVPNQGSLSAYPGTASCGSYGNRNFFMFFNEWFGSTYGSVNITSPLSVESEFSQGLFTNRSVTARFTIKNNTNQRQEVGTVAIGVRDQNDVNFDFGSMKIVLEPWQEYQYEQSRSFNVEGKYTFSIVNFRDAYGWSSSYPETVGGGTRVISNATVQNIPTISVAPSADITELHANQQTTVRFKVKNNSTLYPVSLGYFGVAMTSPSGKNSDLIFDTVAALAPGGTYDYYKAFTPIETGVYTARISATGDGGVTWSEARYPAPLDGATNRLNITVKNSVTMTQGLALNTVNPREGDLVTGTFKIKNFGNTTVPVNKKVCYIVRSSGFVNNDFGCLDVQSLAPGQELTYSGAKAFVGAGQYKAYFSMFDGTYWYDNWNFQKELGTEPTSLQFNVKSNPTLTGGLSIAGNPLRVGNALTGAFSVTNKANAALAINKKLCFIVRSEKMTNHDLGCLELGTLQAGEEKVFSGTKNLLDAGQYKAYLSMFDGTYWHDNWSFEKEVGTEATTLQFSVKDSPTLTQGLTGSTQVLAVGNTFNGGFKVKNNSNAVRVVNKRICYIIRDQSYNNNDLGCLEIGTLAAGQELTYTGSKVITKAGQYKAYFSMFDGTYWHDNWSFEKEVGTEATSLQFVAQ